MGIFSRKKGKEENKTDSGISSSVSEWNQDENNKIPRVLPSTLMQRLSLAQNAKQDVIVPQKIFTDDIRAILKTKSQVKDEYKKIPEDIGWETKHRNLEKHELEKVIMIKEEPKKVQAEPDINVPVVKEIAKQPEIDPVKVPTEHHHHSFFAELEKLFSHKHGVKHVLSQDMMAKMKEYHEVVGKGGSFFMHETDIEREIENSLSSLKEVESEWLLMKKGVVSAERLLFVKEEELERKLWEFKNLLLSANRFKEFNTVSPEGNSFFLSNGERLYSIQHLINELPGMDEGIFYAHVNSEKNDFSSWIRDVFRFEDLALRINSAKTKQEMLQILKKY